MSEYTDEDRAIGWEVIRQLGEPADPAQCAYERLIATAAAAHAREVYAERVKALEGSLRAILGVPSPSPASATGSRRLTSE